MNKAELLQMKDDLQQQLLDMLNSEEYEESLDEMSGFEAAEDVYNTAIAYLSNLIEERA